MKNIKIFQVKNKDYRFCSYDLAKEFGFKFEDYTLVYNCERPANYTLDNAFTEFNINHPADYKGRSLSVSDIVQVDNDKFYCDTIGWVKLA